MRRSSALKCWGGEVRLRRASRPASRRSQLSPTTTSRSKKLFPGFSCQIQQKRTLKAFASTQTRTDSDPHDSGPGDAAAGRALGSQCGPRRLPNLPPRPPPPCSPRRDGGNEGGGLSFWPCCLETGSFPRCESRFPHGVEILDSSTVVRRKGYCN